MEGMRHPMVMSEYDSVWKKYCGFLDISVEQFMAIQQTLLLQQLNEISCFPLGKKLLGKDIPKNVDEFRNSIHLTTYEDYLPDMNPDDGDFLPEKPYLWAHTSGMRGGFKQVPYTLQFYNAALDNLMTVFILACSKHRGQSSLVEADRVLFNVAPSPYMSGILAHGASKKFNLKPVVSPDSNDNIDFKEKIAKNFESSLQTGVDILIAMTSVLVKMGNDFTNHSKNGKLSKYLLHPKVAYRYSRALLQSKLEKRSILPKDLWPSKAIISWGMDTDIYRDLVYKYWGRYPYEFHACTEAGIMALHSWTRKGLTFIPHAAFFEFIPETEWLKNRSDSSYQPRTVLLSEVKPGERYELVITSFHRMPFIRYRLGHLIRITSLEDEEAKIRLPQMVFEARADDLIDIAGFTRISEKTITQAIVNTKLGFEEWSIRKEVKQGKPTLHLYTELDNNHNPTEVASILHQELKNLDSFYYDLDTMIEIHPLKATLLRPGTFKSYYEQEKKAGVELSQRKPPRMNATDDVINKLLSLNGNKD